ncbi:MAG: glycerol-3-phosphate acyltransferase, partial [Chloroflexi bacterium]|nr:glycerol-3-phosphate acyltransferase [Chloroflexota bacterium]
FAYFLFPQAAIPSYFAAALVLVRHAPRIKNVLNGTEPKMYYKIREPE